MSSVSCRCRTIRLGKRTLSGKTRKSPAQFVREVRAELRRVVWPTRRETGVATLMVFVMVAIMSVFFLLVDQVISSAVQAILG